MKIILILCLVTLFICPAFSQKRLVIIGVDGLSPDGIQKAPTPTLDSLIRSGSWSMQAKAVYPSSSSPNWASMITGTSPAHHEIWSNSWKRVDIAEKSYCGGAKGQLFPTIFRAVREQNKTAKIATFYDWDDFGRLLEDDVCTVKTDAAGENETTRLAAEYIASQAPLFTFVHLDHVDHAGHESGHGTPAYYASVTKADSLINNLMNAIRTSGVANETVVIVTADHGGVNKGHGGTSAAEMTIPWIISGKGIKKNHELKTPIDTFDTAVTAAYVLSAKAFPCWTGKAITEAMVEF
ncbi:alkaline phosphatase family protein [Arundinibacter roseus]|uniref:Alkaline phosphatase n=1 Tax=Arundinibacter roseus TaxID=2070510 RepID=A0A4R4K4L2_9BACT|nr:alkaline phosphatase [Arundinibacter roseus]TDB62377.1 alkaline phosphatase [Arundinibacter roseus]